MTLPIWMYWEGAPMPPYLELCRESIERHNPGRVRVLDPVSWDALWTSDRHVVIADLRVEHRADFIRAFLLARYGGTWVDCDTICLRPLGWLIDDTACFAARKEPGMRMLGARSGDKDGMIWLNSFLSSPAGNPVALDVYGQIVRRLLVTDHADMEWNEIGGEVIARAIERARPELVREIPMPALSPWRWQAVLRPAADQTIPETAYGCTLANSMMGQELGTWSRERCLGSATVLGMLFRAALGIT